MLVLPASRAPRRDERHPGEESNNDELSSRPTGAAEREGRQSVACYRCNGTGRVARDCRTRDAERASLRAESNAESKRSKRRASVRSSRTSRRAAVSNRTSDVTRRGESAEDALGGTGAEPEQHVRVHTQPGYEDDSDG